MAVPSFTPAQQAANREEVLRRLKRAPGSFAYGPDVNPRRGANRGWDGVTNTAPQAPTVATQGAAQSTAQSGGGVMPPFMAPKPASPFPAQPATTQGPLASAVPPTAGSLAGAATPSFLSSRPTPTPTDALTPVQSPPRPVPGVAAPMQNQPAPVEAPSEIAAPPGSMTFLRKSLGRGVESVPGGMVVPPANLNVGEASVVAGPSFLNRPVTSAPVAPGSQAGLDNLAAATQAVGRAGYDANQGTARFTQAQRDTNAAGNARLQRGFMSPREREDTLTAERRAFDRGFIGDKLAAAQEIEKTKAGSEVGVAKEQGKTDRYRAEQERAARERAAMFGAAGDVAGATAQFMRPRGGRFKSETESWTDKNGAKNSSTVIYDTETGRKFESNADLEAFQQQEAEAARASEARGMDGGFAPQQKFDEAVRRAQAKGLTLTEEDLAELRRQAGLK